MAIPPRYGEHALLAFRQLSGESSSARTVFLRLRLTSGIFRRAPDESMGATSIAGCVAQHYLRYAV